MVMYPYFDNRSGCGERMSSESGTDTTRTVVQTYVPAYQREEWDTHAEELGMSRSEFVRSMVQAGRRGFGASPDQDSQPQSAEEGGETTSGDQLREQIIDSIEQRGSLSWDELIETVAGDIEARIEEELDELQQEGTVRHSGRKGGYVVEGLTDE